MLLLFDTAWDAVGYALAYQQALNRLVLPLKARAGLHVDPFTLRENSPSGVELGAKPVELRVWQVSAAWADRSFCRPMPGNRWQRTGFAFKEFAVAVELSPLRTTGSGPSLITGRLTAHGAHALHSSRSNTKVSSVLQCCLSPHTNNQTNQPARA